ncbi:hypothetical protein B0H15DRAFT_957606 [Mycena belliarum]|uniref:Uncharacterized protein n=1 Tax=Mycena belliarum TaxID=1033014 RepID=A0AAD6TS45_9AGAR|nr:hypothetical protein B0H15DRAFT_957606 [Mycena belliae]
MPALPRNGQVVPCRTSELPPLPTCSAPFYPSPAFEGPVAHDRNTARNYYLVEFSGHLAVYTDANGCRSNEGVGRQGPLPGAARTAYPTARAVACGVYAACQRNHVHSAEEQAKFIVHESHPPKPADQYIEWTPPLSSTSPTAKAKRPAKEVPLKSLQAKKVKIQSKASKASKASLPPTPKEVKPRGSTLVSAASASPLGRSHVSASSASSESGGSTSPARHIIRASPRLPLRAPPPSPRRIAPRKVISSASNPGPSTAPAEDLHRASAVGGDLVLFVLENGEVYTDGNAAEAALKAQRLTKLKVVESLAAAQSWLQLQATEP